MFDLKIAASDKRKAIAAHNRAARELAKAFHLYGLDEITAANVAYKWTNAAAWDVQSSLSRLLDRSAFPTSA